MFTAYNGGLRESLDLREAVYFTADTYRVCMPNHVEVEKAAFWGSIKCGMLMIAWKIAMPP